MNGDLSFANKTVLVVGGSRGIGNAIACAFRAAGAQVCVTGTRSTPNEYDGEGGSFEGLHYRQLEGADAAAIDTLALPFSSLSVLVNSQGIAPPDNVDPLDLDVFERVIEVNLLSVFRLCHRFRPMLRAERGTVINIGSLACFIAVPHRPSYSASKGGLLTLTKSLGSAWAAEGIRVNGIAPGYIATRLSKHNWSDPIRSAAVEARIPMGRWGSVDEIAMATLFLASPLASYITGQMIAVDGGLGL